MLLYAIRKRTKERVKIWPLLVLVVVGNVSRCLMVIFAIILNKAHKTLTLGNAYSHGVLTFLYILFVNIIE